jgi:hypothetical protein
VKTITVEAMAAITAGEAIVTGAVEIIPIERVVAPDFLTDFSGLAWELPGLSDFSSTVYNCGSGTTDVYTVTGPAGGTVDATFRVRGVVELNEYSGGSAGTPSYVYTGATGNHANVNRYKLIVSDPPATYWLNNGTFTNFDLTALDYELAVTVNVGATITLQSESADNKEVKNNTSVSAPDDDVLHPIAVSQPYAGQFMQVDALTATSVGSTLRIWGGYGPILIGGQSFAGVGNSFIAKQSAGAIGGVAQGLTLALSGIEPALLELMDDAEAYKGAAVVIYRLIFASDGKTLLDAHVFDRGRLDAVGSDEVVGAAAAISGAVESAARGLGRSGSRMRADADQRLISASDGYFKHTAYAAQKMLYWGGKRPVRTGEAHGGGGLLGGLFGSVSS